MSKGGGGGGGGTQTVVNKTELPQWVQDAAQKNLAAAYDVMGSMAGPYEGARVAGLTDQNLANIQGLQNAVGMSMPGYAAAQAGAGSVLGFQPGQVNPSYVGGMDLSAYMNPYTSAVTAAGMQAIDQQRRQALNQNADAAIRVGAFGGSRHGVTEAVTNAAAANQAGQLAANLQSQNYNQAMTAAQADIGRNMLAQQLNQQAGLTGAQLNLNAAQQLGALAGAGQNSYLQGIGAAVGGQEAIQANQQAYLDALRAAYGEAQAFPVNQLQIPLSALGATPYGGTSTQTSPGPTSNTGMSLLGGGLAGYQLGSALLGSTALGSTGGGFLGAGLGALLGLSDEREKTDIKRIGKDKETGLPMYSYRYKGDPKTYPKVTGPMAQDVAEQYPDQVTKVGNRLAVNLGFGPVRRAMA